MYFALMTVVVCAAPVEPPDTVIVCPRSFLPELRPWIVHRQGQGHRLTFVSNELSPDDIRSAIRKTAQSGVLKYVVLVGDADPAGDLDEHVRARSTPTHRIEAKVNIRWGSDPEIATDNPYADLDDDQIPDVAIGRITADSPTELSRMVRKILAYETAADSGLWRRQMNFVAGVGGFGTLVDSILQMATRKFLTDGIPAGYNTSMTYASWQSPYCPDPRRFHDVTLARLNEGCLFWVYMGHGHRRHLGHIRVPGAAFPILDIDDASNLRSARGLPIALLLACHAGGFDQASDCLAEEMLRADRGPVAAICGSRVTMPYGMAVMSNAMMEELFRKKRPTLGQLLLHAKRRMASRDEDDANRQLLDAIASAVSPSADQLNEERIEHLSLFNLIGDPLLVIRHPRGIELTSDSKIAAGERLTVSGQSPCDGNGVIELACRRDRTKTSPPVRNRFIPTDAFLRSFQEAYRQANDQCWISQTLTVEGGEFEAQLTVPRDARGSCHVRVYVEGADGFALGATNVFVRRPKPDVGAAPSAPSNLD